MHIYLYKFTFLFMILLHTQKNAILTKKLRHSLIYGSRFHNTVNARNFVLTEGECPCDVLISKLGRKAPFVNDVIEFQ